MEQKIGSVAYKLKLPSSCSIHLVIHVSQLKKALALGEKTQNELPRSDDNSVPKWVLRRCLYHARSASGTQVLVLWSGSSLTNATWEDLSELHTLFHHAPAWGQAVIEEGGMLQNQRNHMTVNRRCSCASKVMEAVSASSDRLIAIQRQNGFIKHCVSAERESRTPLASSRCGWVLICLVLGCVGAFGMYSLEANSKFPFLYVTT